MLKNIMFENEGRPTLAKNTTLSKAHPTYRKTPFPEYVRILFWKFGYRRREVGQLKQCV